ncbi:hypothetical protein Nepgr_020888 [Nepenthes gracilis]|uniref:Uncharacterized protein n=1 Tax=Nepenthes gracilis TaxID=150966 RepID=A0AAD3XVG2_NEPGR|nr:hypothetical protein Nepgr_020888 [Nepenthes gracilis]
MRQVVRSLGGGNGPPEILILPGRHNEERQRRWCEAGVSLRMMCIHINLHISEKVSTGSTAAYIEAGCFLSLPTSDAAD